MPEIINDSIGQKDTIVGWARLQEVKFPPVHVLNLITVRKGRVDECMQQIVDDERTRHFVNFPFRDQGYTGVRALRLIIDSASSPAQGINRYDHNFTTADSWSLVPGIISEGLTVTPGLERGFKPDWQMGSVALLGAVKDLLTQTNSPEEDFKYFYYLYNHFAARSDRLEPESAEFQDGTEHSLVALPNMEDTTEDQMRALQNICLSIGDGADADQLAIRHLSAIDNLLVKAIPAERIFVRDRMRIALIERGIIDNSRGLVLNDVYWSFTRRQATIYGLNPLTKNPAEAYGDCLSALQENDTARVIEALNREGEDYSRRFQHALEALFAMRALRALEKSHKE